MCEIDREKLPWRFCGTSPWMTAGCWPKGSGPSMRSPSSFFLGGQTLEYIARKTDLEVLKDRARLYIQRIKSGAHLSMSAV